MKARHSVGDVVVARHHQNDRWSEAVIRQVCHVQTWIEYKVSFRNKNGEWAKRIYWAEVQREEARPVAS